MLKRLPQDQLEDQSVAAVMNFFNHNKWQFAQQPRDKSGIDGEIEIVHGIERTGRFLKFQIKAGLSYISSESGNHLKVKIERKYLEHWAKMTLPVLLFFYHPTTQTIFWKAIKEYLVLYPSLLTRESETCTLTFDKEQDGLRTESLPAIEAVEAGKFRYDSILVEPTLAELGWSNWFPVKKFPLLWRAELDEDNLTKMTLPWSNRYAFVVQDNGLLTFSDVRSENSEIRNFIRIGSVRNISQESVSHPTLVQLLNQSLRILATSRDLIFSRGRFYFSPDLLKTPEANKFSYVPLKGGRLETRTKIYIQNLGARVEYKHHAVRLSFLQHLGEWYLQVDPDWFFTYPYGKRRTATDIGVRITTEKATTRNKDYLYLLHFWRQFLSNGGSTIKIPSWSVDDTNSIETASQPLNFDFKFRFFNDYVGPKTTIG